MNETLEAIDAKLLDKLKKAYQRGYAKAREELLGGEPDAYASISPKGELSDVAMSRQSLGYRMSRIVASEYKNYEQMVADMEEAVNEQLADGWQIVPVKLVKMEVEK